MFALFSCAHTMGMRYMCWSPSYGTQILKVYTPIRRDVGIVGGYDWWLVNGTGVHGS